MITIELVLLLGAVVEVETDTVLVFMLSSLFADATDEEGSIILLLDVKTFEMLLVSVIITAAGGVSELKVTMLLTGVVGTDTTLMETSSSLLMEAVTDMMG